MSTPQTEQAKAIKPAVRPDQLVTADGVRVLEHTGSFWRIRYNEVYKSGISIHLYDGYVNVTTEDLRTKIDPATDLYASKAAALRAIAQRKTHEAIELAMEAARLETEEKQQPPAQDAERWDGMS